MAITPRTVLSDPVNLLFFAAGIFVLGGLIGVFAGAKQSDPPSVTYAPSPEPVDLDAGQAGPIDGPPPGTHRAAPHAAEGGYLDHVCRVETPQPGWSEGQWLRHLECMEARGEGAEVLLDETTAAIEQVGLSPELALRKADLLEEAGSADEHIAFLDAAVQRLGLSDGRLVHRLARAMTWRGEADDVMVVRRLLLMTRMLMPNSCEVLQTDMWVRYALAGRLAERPSPAAWRGVEHGVHTYMQAGCHERVDQSDRTELAEIAGVGVAAEAANGHSGHSTLIRHVAEAAKADEDIALSQEERSLEAFCEEAVPAGVELRADCEKRVGDELFLAR